MSSLLFPLLPPAFCFFYWTPNVRTEHGARKTPSRDKKTGDTAEESVKRLKDLKSKSKVIILLTDGRNNTGNITPFQAAEIAKVFGIKIYTVGVGTQGQAPFLVDSMFGQKVVYQDVELDEATLIKIAELTHGKYFRATDTDSLKKIYREINQLEKSEVKWIDHSEFKELYLFFLVPAMLLVFLELVLSETRLRRVP